MLLRHDDIGLIYFASIIEGFKELIRQFTSCIFSLVSHSQNVLTHSLTPAIFFNEVTGEWIDRVLHCVAHL